MGIAQTAIAWAIPKWRSQRFNWGFPKLNSMLKLRDHGHLLLEDVDSFTSANDTMLDEEQDTIEEFFHPDLQIPKVCYQTNKTQVSHSWCLFKPKNRHGVTLIGILRGREGQHVSGVWRSHQSIWISNNTKIDVSTIEMGFLAIIRLWWTSLLATIDCI